MALDGLNGMGGLLRYEDCYGRFQKHVLGLMGPALLEVGWTSPDTEPHLTKLLRSVLLANAVSLGHQYAHTRHTRHTHATHTPHTTHDT
jgi:hypothetical protein